MQQKYCIFWDKLKDFNKNIFKLCIILTHYSIGFSHTILVYGMTGSGKTFTMFGDNFEESST